MSKVLKEKKKIKTICGSEVNVLCIADDFKEAYKRCARGENLRREDCYRMVAECVNIPAIVNGAFACELYLKSITKTDQCIHKIKELYLMLPAEKQESLRKAMDPIIPKQYGLSFDECLDDIPNSFVYWRYIYEKDSVGKLGLNGTLMILPKLIDELSKMAHEKDSQNS